MEGNMLQDGEGRGRRGRRERHSEREKGMTQKEGGRYVREGEGQGKVEGGKEGGEQEAAHDALGGKSQPYHGLIYGPFHGLIYGPFYGLI